MQAEPTLSVGVPVRNGARFLRRLLTSLEAQDFDLARYHSTIKEVKHATEVRLAPRWMMYRDLAKVLINSSLSPMDRSPGTAQEVFFGGLHHVRASGERAIELVGQGQGAATAA